jgi:hypothetical protein
LVAKLNLPDFLSMSRVWRCRFSTAIMLGFLAAFATQQTATAQESTRSHRLLGNGLPSLSGGQSQMELFRRLQLLSGAAQANGKTPADSPLADPEALRRLQQAMQSLQKLNPEPFKNTLPGQQATSPGGGESSTDNQSSGENRNSGAPQTLPSGRNAKSNPPATGSPADRSTLQRIAEQMGLSLDGPDGISPDSGTPGADPAARQPRSNDRSGAGSNPADRSPKTPSVPTPSVPTSEDRFPGFDPARPGNDRNPAASKNSGSSTSPGGTAGRPSPQQAPSSNSSDRSGSGGSTPGRNSRPVPGQEGGEPAEPPKSSMQALLDWMKKQNSSGKGGGLSTDSSGSSPDRSPATRSGKPDDERLPQPRTGTGSSPRNLGQRRDDSATGRASIPNEPSTPDTSWFPGGSIAPPRSQQSGDGQGNSTTAQGGMNRQGIQPGGSSSPPSVGQAPGSSPNRSKTPLTAGSTGSDNEIDSTTQSAQDRLNDQRQQRLDEVRDSKKTLRQKLADIAKLARSESNENETSDSATESGAGDSLQSAFVEALAEATRGLAEQVDEIVTDDRFSRQDRDRRGSRRDRGGPFRQFAGLGNRASEWFVDAVEPAAPSTSIADNGLSGTAGNGSERSSGLLAGLLIVCGLVFWMLRKKRINAQSQSGYSRLSPVPANLQNRQDIVQAFHDLAARCPDVLADWWTHDRAAQALASARPDVDEEVRQLARLYEQARYLPADSSLTDEQLAAAKAAWLRCRTS